MPALSYFPILRVRHDVMPTFAPMSMKAARRYGAKAARRGGSLSDNPYPADSCAAAAWCTGFRLAKPVVYQVNLIVDGNVIDAGHATNCKHAIRGAYKTLAGIPQAEICVRANGRFVFWLHTNFRGEIDEIESHFRRDSVVLPLNPKWSRWPQFVSTPKGTVQQALKGETNGKPV